MDYIDNMIAYREASRRRDEYNEAKALNEAQIAEAEKRRSVVEHYDNLKNQSNLSSKIATFYNEVYRTLLTETFTALAVSSMNHINNKDMLRKRSVLESLMKSYVNDREVRDMQRNFASTSQFLAEVNLVCDKYATIISEKAKEKCKGKKCSEISNDDIFNIEQPDKDDFYKEIDAINADELSYTIRNRVMDATQDFIDSYNRDKTELKNILKDTSNTINFLKENANSKPQIIKENSNLEQYYADKAKRRMKDVTDKKITSVYEAMVLGFSKSVYKNQQLSEVFITEGTNLDTDAVRDHCEILYTFMETLNTAKIQKMDEEFLSKQMYDIANM